MECGLLIPLRNVISQCRLRREKRDRIFLDCGADKRLPEKHDLYKYLKVSYYSGLIGVELKKVTKMRSWVCQTANKDNRANTKQRIAALLTLYHQIVF